MRTEGTDMETTQCGERGPITQLRLAASATVLAGLLAMAPGSVQGVELVAPEVLAASEDIEDGRELIDEREYDEAVEVFTRAYEAATAAAAAAAAEAESAAAPAAADRAVAAAMAEAASAVYWRAYALRGSRRYAEALATLEGLRAQFPRSNWADDGRVLEQEIRRALRDRERAERERERAVMAEERAVMAEERAVMAEERERARLERAQQDPGYEYEYEYPEYEYEYEYSYGHDGDAEDDLVLYALHGLMGQDPERAIPVLERFLQGEHPRHHKQQALFVLSQAEDPRAFEIIMDYARDGSDPDLQVQAIQMFIVMGSDNFDEIDTLYDESADPRVKRALLEAAMANGHSGLLSRVVRDESAEAAVRVHAIQMLGVTGDTAVLTTMYDAGLPFEMRRAMLDAFGIAGDPEPVVEILWAEEDPGLRGHALRSLGIMGRGASEVVAEIYPRLDTEMEKRAAIEALMIMDDGPGLRELYSQEEDPVLKRHIVQMLTVVGDEESMDVFLEILDEAGQ